ncbi:MAG: DNA gyrase inhibitor YacG [Gammaproteobacteria bacterium]
MNRRCPRCGLSIAQDQGGWRPFCSERCKLIDLGHWAAESYHIAAEPQDATPGDEATPTQAGLHSSPSAIPAQG